ncbi:zinc ABC transporter substrate-binding protein [Thioclava atlantica]|uniref:High-affinity zinc uptake system protein ZnuA n=1 Tax=Thioclava atlantica TaxID=1317124 RepID=A0A085U1U3_9RHOB|nr:zinc ABC transporter substrate-binding protein [Thioclava atlantica]KFE36940.1 zinc ABC transporter periplasmic zinc-binding protein ZnuA [Thioclava atlantica]
MRLSLALILSALALPNLAQAEVPKVLTDIPPVQSLAAQVMGDLGTPEILLDQGADPHEFQLRPSKARALQDASVTFWVGPELEPWLARALEGIGTKGQAVELLEAPGTHPRQFGAADAHDEAAGGHADGHGDEHDHAGTDPHAWLDPSNAQAWLGAIAETLAKADPEHAATYRANAEAAKARIAAMDGELRAKLAPVVDKPILVFHDAYGYFADHYGLHVAGTLSLGDAATPGAAHVSELRKLAEQSGAVCAFPEAQHDPKMISLLVQGTPVKLGAPLDPSGSGLDYGRDLYETLMRSNVEKITACLSGS